ncbi:intradiol ring-cleavage dioxygenase [Aspergillus affinis]|uniref:intradiol ring-cleavage dioxygenase n=1 Tax=Aspergillus affinis TaxID=1070780 RepID=UPI0022FE6BDE|nr:extracellular dioxygenase [Aspergillus affinis]KAI9034782.1 extracellular dioxygenase [Aspergillus affinis]
MVHLASTLAAGLAGLASIASAHPGHDHKAEAAQRAAFMKRAPVHSRSLDQCADKLRARGQEKKNIARRDRMVQELRAKKGVQARAPFLKARDLDTVLNTTHHSSLDVNLSTDPEVLFASNATCILGPDVTQGPYYVTGEMIRSDLIEDQEGVPLYMDIQMIDTSTCEPVPEVYVDFWHCNATGVYSGISASGNGNSDDTNNLDATFLRGLQKTDKDGILQFKTIFPGHYTSRATHIHVLSHPANETTVNRNNNTISGLYTSSSSYVGQLFFDQDLISKVEETAPYNTNTQELTTNAEDSILSEEADTIDPFVEYVFLGDDVSDGIFSWISFGFDPSASTDVTPAAYLTEEGGIENENAGMGMGGGGGAPPGSSSIPSASASTSA